MMGCGTSKVCGCVAFGGKRYDDDSTVSSYRSSDASEAQVKDIKRKSTNDSGFMKMLSSPRNFFKGWRRNEYLSMPKVERSKWLMWLLHRHHFILGRQKHSYVIYFVIFCLKTSIDSKIFVTNAQKYKWIHIST